MNKPAQEDIQAEIEKLKKMKPNVRRLSFFSNDNHAKIDIQIEVLENNLDEEEIYDRYGYDTGLDDALYALQWMDGDEDEPPSEQWASLVE